MQTHKLNKKAIAVTGLPENSRYKIFNDEKPYLSFFNGYETFRLYLPPGKWRALGFAQDLGEVDWKRVVQMFSAERKIGGRCTYVSYNSMDIYDNATESANSLLESEGIELLNTLILIIE